MAEPTPIEKARSLIYQGNIEAGRNALIEVLNGEFFHPEALMMLGATFIGQGMHGLGAVISSAAIDAKMAANGKPYPEALMNLGAAFRAEGHRQHAEIALRESLLHETIVRHRAELLVNIAGLYVNEGNPEKAIELCNQALQEDPTFPGARAQRGMAHLELRHWREGWKDWLATYETGDRKRREYGTPVWDGSPGKRLICWGEQGIGDEIYYANCLPDLIAKSEGVIFDCHPRLVKLFERSFPEITVHGTRKHLTGMDWIRDSGAQAAVSIADLPGFFRNDESDWDGKAYLHPASVAEGPAVKGENLRIGLSWAGGSKKTKTAYRCVPLMELEPILRAVPNAHWFSLQYTENGPIESAAKEVCEFEEATGIHIAHFPGWVECFDYDRTASFVSSLDLIITVCTTIHHLGGALGVPTWTMVPTRASWRYGVRGDTLPWYGSAKLFRQEKDGDWSQPIERIIEDLKRAYL